MSRKRVLHPPQKTTDIQVRVVGHLERPEVLPCQTYCIYLPGPQHKAYITISDHKVEGSIRPFEIFFSSKYTEGFQFTSALMRLVSGRFQEPGPFPYFVVEELIDTFDTEGGYWIQEKWLKEAFQIQRVPSIVSHLGYVLKFHCQKLGVSE